MARPKIDRDRAAEILAEAEIKGDRETAQIYNITTRTIENYRARLSFDRELSEVFKKTRKERQAGWIDEVPSAIALGIEFLKGSFQQADRHDPDAIAAVTQSVEMLADLELTRQMIDKRLAGVDVENSNQT